MAKMELLTPSQAGTTDRSNRTEAGGTVAWAADSAHKYENTGIEFLRVEKGAGAAIMTLTTYAPDQYGLELPDRSVTIGANSTEYYGPYSPEAHNERSGNDKDYTSIAFSEVTGVKVTVIQPGERRR